MCHLQPFPCSVVSFSCPVGHLFSTGVKEMVSSCRPGGSWDNDYIPACVEAYCGPVPQIDNGFAVIASNVTWRGVAQFQVWLPTPCSLLPAPCSLLPAPCSLLTAPCSLLYSSHLPPHQGYR